MLKRMKKPIICYRTVLNRNNHDRTTCVLNYNLNGNLKNFVKKSLKEKEKNRFMSLKYFFISHFTCMSTLLFLK